MVAAGKIRGRGSSRPYLVFSFGIIFCDTSLKLASLVTFSLSEDGRRDLCQSLGQDQACARFTLNRIESTQIAKVVNQIKS